MTTELLLLGVLWCCWCAVHSLLIAEPVKAWVLRCLPIPSVGYRLFYNLVALTLLLPVLVWSLRLSDSDLLVSWSGFWVMLQGVFWVAAGALTWFGCRVYPLDEFLGLDCLHRAEKKPPPTLVKDGVLGVVRHPWYLAGLLVLWARDLDRAALVTSTVLSGYLLLGAMIEERRLVRLYGLNYAEYRRRVPMLIPWRWLVGIWRQIMKK